MNRTSISCAATTSAALLLGPLAGAPALADVVESYRFSVQRNSSEVATDISVTSTLAGTLIGNYDEKANPGGTRTIPGVFGPTSGNFPIDFSGTAGLVGNDRTRPEGEFTLTLDPKAGVATVAGLRLDITASGGLGVVLGLTIEYDSFRTRQPTALFLGGIPITIPFGVYELNSFTLTQTELTGPGVLEETGKGSYRVTLLAPVEVRANIDVLLGDPIPLGPIVVPVPFVLEVTLDGDRASASLALEQSFAQQVPLELELPANQALDLPTVLPPGGTAHLLLNGSLGALDAHLGVSAMIMAAGERREFARADWDRNGVVNSLDFYLFVIEFLTIGVDFNADGRSDSQDFFDFVTEYFNAR
jgi:hypothetical protein